MAVLNTGPQEFPLGQSDTRFAETAWIDKWRAEALSRVEYALSELLQGAGSLAYPLSHAAAVRGKRLRPLMVLASASLGSAFQEPSPDAVSAAAAIEAIHEASLIHDDIVDWAQARRGQPALAARFGVMTASHTALYLAGRGLAQLADICGRNSLPIDFSVLKDLALAQILDSLPPASDLLHQHRRLSTVTDGKTGVLFILAVRVGAALAPCSLKAHSRDLDGFASALGRAFQIRDDILDIEGDPLLRRPGANDLQHGAMTWPIWLWAEMAEDWQDATAKLKRCRQQIDEALALRSEVVISGAVARARSLMDAELDSAASYLARLPFSAGRTLLMHLLYELRWR